MREETQFQRFGWLMLALFAIALLFMATGQGCGVRPTTESKRPSSSPRKSPIPATKPMHEFVRSTAHSMEEPEEVIRLATESLLVSIRKRVGPVAFEPVTRRIPGVRFMLGSRFHPSITPAGAACSGLAGSLAESGLDAEKHQVFAARFVWFLRAEGGDRLVESLLHDVPDLAAIAG